MRRALIGAGGYSHDLVGLFGMVPRFVDDKYWKKNDEKILPLSEFDPSEWEVQVAVANPRDRQDIVERMPEGTKYFTFVHPSAQMFGQGTIGYGTTIGPNAIIMYNGTVGNHCIINTNSVIGHDASLSDFVTMAPLSGIMGNCIIGQRVEFGAGAMCRPRILICDDVMVGMGACVVKDILSPGVYAGVPAKKIK